MKLRTFSIKQKLSTLYTHSAKRLLWAFILLAFSVTTHAGNEACSNEVITAIGKHFKLQDLSALSQKVITDDCKKWPTNKTLALFVYDSASSQKTLFLAIVDKNLNVLSAYNTLLPEEDSIIRIGDGSIKLDVAPYLLSTNTRGFGVVFDIKWLPCAVEGGSAQELQLFIDEEKHIRPIFENPTPIFYWHRETTDCFNSKKYYSTPITLQILKSSSNGFSDLKFTAKETEDIEGLDIPEHKKPSRHFSLTVKYNGSIFDLKPWKTKFSCWYESDNCE